MAHILLGVTGSIAAFKACHLASDWSKQGHEVRVAMTAAAQEFVTPLTFSSLTHTQTRTSMFAAQRNDGDVAHTPSDPLHINHVDDAKWADMLVIAPASADIIAKIACGIADDRELGWTIVEPGSGMLACQDVGKGRMEEPAAIEAAVADLLRANQPAETLPLHGLHVLVTAGPTQEPLDPVRYLTNHSTGKMGYAIAEQARDMGADVTLVSGPVTLSAPRGIDTVHVTTAQQMFNAVQEHFTQADLTIMAAAVGDFRPIEQSSEKIKKNGRVNIDLRLTSNPDILAWAGAHKTAGQTLCGFAMETQDLESNAAKKLTSKHCSMLVANNLNTPGAGFAVDTNVVTVLKPGETTDEPIIEHWNKMSKQELAERILTELAALRNTESAESQAS